MVLQHVVSTLRFLPVEDQNMRLPVVQSVADDALLEGLDDLEGDWHEQRFCDSVQQLLGARASDPVELKPLAFVHDSSVVEMPAALTVKVIITFYSCRWNGLCPSMSDPSGQWSLHT